MEDGFPGGVHLFGLVGLVFPEVYWLVWVKERGGCKEVCDSGEALVGVDGKKCW